MRTCEERTRDVLERRDAYRKRQQKRQSAIALGTLCLTLVMSICLGALPRLRTAPQAEEPVASSYAELFAAVKKYDHETYVLYGDEAEDMVAGSAPNMNGSGLGVDGALKGEVTEDSADDHSDTNLQVAGVDEADIVKTDGKHIYVLSGHRVVIVDPNDGKPQKLTEFSFERPDGEINETTDLYLVGDRLVVLQYRYDATTESTRSVSRIYDVSQPSRPVFVNRFEQDGNPLSTRMIGDILYTVSRYMIHEQPIENQPATYVPVIACGTEEAVLPADDVYICEESYQYMVVTAVRVSGNGELLSKKAVMTSGDTVYANTKNLYIAGATYLSSETPIVRFALNNGQVEKQAETTVDGDLLNQFSMDEHNGYLRVVLTKRSTKGELTNSLLVLDSDLKVVGSLTGLAADERVYSVRFSGDTGYFVTFKQVDPLFTVDLSDPTKPVIQSQLKIPGFSQYLHPYGDGLLLGIGKDADENGRATFMKLSMFNVSDPTAVTESDVKVLDQKYSEVLYNHKAALIDVEKNLIGFATADNTYHLYGYDAKDGFVLKARVPVLDGHSVRGLYIGEHLYVISYQGILTYRMDDFSGVGALSIIEMK